MSDEPEKKKKKKKIEKVDSGKLDVKKKKKKSKRVVTGEDLPTKEKEKVEEDKGEDRSYDKGEDRLNDKGEDRSNDKGEDRSNDKGEDRSNGNEDGVVRMGSGLDLFAAPPEEVGVVRRDGVSDNRTSQYAIVDDFMNDPARDAPERESSQYAIVSDVVDPARDAPEREDAYQSISDLMALNKRREAEAALQPASSADPDAAIPRRMSGLSRTSSTAPKVIARRPENAGGIPMCSSTDNPAGDDEYLAADVFAAKIGSSPADVSPRSDGPMFVDDSSLMKRKEVSVRSVDSYTPVSVGILEVSSKIDAQARAVIKNILADTGREETLANPAVHAAFERIKEAMSDMMAVLLDQRAAGDLAKPEPEKKSAVSKIKTGLPQSRMARSSTSLHANVSRGTMKKQGSAVMGNVSQESKGPDIRKRFETMLGRPGRASSGKGAVEPAPLPSMDPNSECVQRALGIVHDLASRCESTQRSGFAEVLFVAKALELLASPSLAPLLTGTGEDWGKLSSELMSLLDLVVSEGRVDVCADLRRSRSLQVQLDMVLEAIEAIITLRNRTSTERLIDSMLVLIEGVPHVFALEAMSQWLEYSGIAKATGFAAPIEQIYSVGLGGPAVGDDKLLSVMRVCYGVGSRISFLRYVQLLHAMGPRDCVLRNVRQLVESQSFLGFLSASDAKNAMHDQYKGQVAYAVLFDDARADQFLIVTSTGVRQRVGIRVSQLRDRSWLHQLVLIGGQYDGVVADANYGFAFHELVVRMTGEAFVVEVDPTTFMCSAFSGDLPGSVAESTLRHCPAGTYIIRWSSTPGNLTISLSKGSPSEGKPSHVIHNRVKRSPAGLEAQAAPGPVPNMAALLEANKTHLTKPHKGAMGSLCQALLTLRE